MEHHYAEGKEDMMKHEQARMASAYNIKLLMFSCQIQSQIWTSEEWGSTILSQEGKADTYLVNLIEVNQDFQVRIQENINI